MLIMEDSEKEKNIIQIQTISLFKIHTNSYLFKFQKKNTKIKKKM